MNWLAHLWLADQSHTSAAGQMLGDDIKGRITPHTSPLGHFVATGIVLHRRIDQAADAHEQHRDLRALFQGNRRRYAGIAVDIGLDYALARTWTAFNPESLVVFAKRQAAAIAAEWPAEALGRSAPSAAPFARLLTGYSRLSAVTRALGHVESRLRRPVSLTPMADTIEYHRADFEQAIGPILADLLNVVTARPGERCR